LEIDEVSYTVKKGTLAHSLALRYVMDAPGIFDVMGKKCFLVKQERMGQVWSAGMGTCLLHIEEHTVWQESLRSE